MVRIIKILLIIVVIAALAVASFIKINNAILKDFEVVNLNNIYKEKGLPVFTNTVSKMKTVPFIKDIALVKEGKVKNTYSALVSRDLLSSLKVGTSVYIPKDREIINNDVAKAKLNFYLPKVAYIGKIVSIASEADWQTGFYKVIIKMNQELPEKPFQTGKVVYKTANNATIALITVLENSNGKYYAWIYDNGTARKSLLKTGTCDGYICEILSGLKVGDQIITSDLKRLEPGLKLFNAGSDIKND